VDCILSNGVTKIVCYKSSIAYRSSFWTSFPCNLEGTEMAFVYIIIENTFRPSVFDEGGPKIIKFIKIIK
jgi:hypothetical protein